MATINLDFIADISQATKQVADFTKKAGTQLEGLSKTFKTISITAAGAFAAIGVGFSLKKAIDEASAFEVEVNRLKTALELSGITSEQATKDFLDYASALQKTTTFSDDAVLSTASLIQSISKLPTDQLQRATKAALDLSTALRIDLNTASRLVAKAAEGNVDAFRRYGIQIEKGKDNTQTFANALTALESKFGGSSEKAINTFAGATTQLANNANDALKAFGLIIIQNESLISTIKGVSDRFAELAVSIENNSGAIGKTINATSFLIDLFRKMFLGFSAKEFEDLFPVKPINDAIDSTDSLIESAKAYRSVLNQQNIELVKNKKEEEDRAKLAEQGRIQFQQTKSAFDSLDSKFKTFNLDPVKAEINQTNKNLSDLEKARRAGLVQGQNYEDLRLKIQQDGDKRVLAAQEKQKQDELKLRTEANQKISDQIQAVISSVKQGAAGAASLASFGAGQAANIIAPGSGGAVSEAVSFLTQDPELVKAQIQGFIDGIPIIIDNFVANVPLIIDTLAANSGKIATALSLAMPTVANRLGIELVKQAPNIARAFVNSLISEAGRIVQTISDGIKEALNKITGGIAGGAGGILSSVGGFVGGIGKRLGFADGGVVPGGAPFTDRIPAMLTPGEYVLSRDDIKSLVTNSEKQASPGRTTEMVTINLQIGQEKLASVIYDLNKRGFRLS